MAPFPLPTIPNSCPCPFSTMCSPGVFLSHCPLQEEPFYPPKRNSADKRRADSVLGPCHELAHLWLPQPAVTELPGSLLRADYGLPEDRMCLVMSPHTVGTQCVLCRI